MQKPKTDRTKKCVREIALEINERHNANTPPCSVEKLVQEVTSGENPPKRGPINEIPQKSRSSLMKKEKRSS